MSKKGKKSETFIVTEDFKGEYELINELELEKYAVKADVDPSTGSKQTPPEWVKRGIHLLDPPYTPYNLVKLLDLNSYHEACVDAVATDAAGLKWTLNPIEGVD